MLYFCVMASAEMIQISKAEYDAYIALKSRHEKLQSGHEKLKSGYEELQSGYKELQSGHEDLQKAHEELQSNYDGIRFELDQLKRLIFGSKSERFKPSTMDPEQLSLFDIPAEDIEPQKEQITYSRKQPKAEKKQPIRGAFSAHLPRVEQIMEVEDLPEGAKCIGKDESEYLEYKKAELFVVKVIRPKYIIASDDESTTIVQAPPKALPLPKSKFGPGILTELFIGKYVDHMPFYRQARKFERLGERLPVSTISGLFSGGAGLLVRLYDCLADQLISTDYLMGDETPIRVLTKDKPKATHKGYFWTYADPIRRMAVFDYRTSRGREGPNDFLKNFTGFLQTDGYAAYNNLHPDKINLLACMAHARRKFFEAKDNDPQRSTLALEMFKQLYAIEAQIRDEGLEGEQVTELRKKEAKPILDEIKAWLDKEILSVAPQSAIGRAMAYSLNLWSRLIRYIEQPRFHIDNNLVENTIRPVALGRKNYLFAGSHNAARHAAVFYSLLVTCKMRNVEPSAWLEYVFNNISTWPEDKLNELLPGNAPTPKI